MNRLPLFFAQLVVALALLSAYGWAVKHRTKGDLNLGWANAVVDGAFDLDEAGGFKLRAPLRDAS